MNASYKKRLGALLVFFAGVMIAFMIKVAFDIVEKKSFHTSNEISQYDKDTQIKMLQEEVKALKQFIAQQNEGYKELLVRLYSYQDKVDVAMGELLKSVDRIDSVAEKAKTK